MFRLCVGVHWLANSIQIQLALVVRQYTIPLSVAVFCHGPKPACVFSLHFADSFKNIFPPLHAKIDQKQFACSTASWWRRGVCNTYQKRMP